MKTVLTYGTFDLFHIGHVRLLRRVRSMGDQLVVGCSTDEFNRLKGKDALFSYRDRKEILESCKFVDLVIPEHSWEQKIMDIEENEVSILAMGDDWRGKFDGLEKEAGVTVTYISRTPGVSTTKVKDVLSSLNSDRKANLLKLVEDLSAELEEL